MGCKDNYSFENIKTKLFLFPVLGKFIAQVGKALIRGISVKQVPVGDMGFLLRGAKLAVHPVYRQVVVSHP